MHDLSSPRHGRSLVAFFVAPAILAAMAACTDPARRGSIGDNCFDDSECVEGICGGGICIDPMADDDGDSLLNQDEVRIGTNPRNADSDFDGYPDGDEVDSNGALRDTDGDGVPDILESATHDADGDCIPDQFDPENDVKNSDLTGIVPIICRTVGACADTAKLVVNCEDGYASAVCDYGAVPGFEAEETSCDGIDNDCDGVTDDGAPDSDKDGVADCIDPDIDGDDADNDSDNCPNVRNPDQADADGDDSGDACDPPLPPILLAIAPGPVGNAVTITLIGEREPGSIVNIYNNTQCTGAALGTLDADTQVAFSTTVTTVEGLNRFALRATNPALLESACAPSGLTYTRDTVAPANADPDKMTVSPTSPSFSDSPLVTGNAEPDARICFYSDDTCTTLIDCANVPESGLFESRVPLAGVGNWSIHATVSDAAGNASACAWVFDHEVLPAVLPRPAAPSYFGPQPFVEGSPNNTTTAPTLRVCGPADAPVRAYTNAACSGTAVAMAAGGSDAACGGGTVHSATVVANPNGVTDFWALTGASDGWTSTCVYVGRFEHDNVAPPALGGLVVNPASPGRHPAPTISAQGTEAFATVAIHTGNDCNSNANVTFVADSNGAVRGAVTVAPNTTTTFRATTTDRIGNRSTCHVLGSYTHDDIAPAMPGLDISWTNPTRERTIPLEGCAEALARVEFFSDAACTTTLATATAGAAGTCTGGLGAYATSAPAALDATTRINARVSDAAGNVSACFPLATYVHDEEPPPAPILAEETVIGWTATTVGFRISGVAEPFSFVQILSVVPGAAMPTNGPCSGTNPVNLTADANGRFTTDLTVSRAAATSVSAWSRDAAGNGSLCAPEQGLVGLATLSAGGDYAAPDGPALLFHDPDGHLMDWAYDASDLAPTLSALVFRGCFGSAAWVPELRGYADRRRLDIIELVPGDDRHLPRPLVNNCRNCYGNDYGQSAIATVSVTGAPANSTVRFYADYYQEELAVGQSATVYLYPDQRERYTCVSGTPSNCDQWNYLAHIYAVVVDGSGYILGYADAGDVIYLPGGQFNVTMPFRNDNKRFSFNITNNSSSFRNGFLENFALGPTRIFDRTHVDYDDPYGNSADFMIPAGGSTTVNAMHFPAFGDWGVQMGAYTLRDLPFARTYAYSFMFQGGIGLPPDVVTRDINDGLPPIELLDIRPPTEDTRGEARFGLPEAGVAQGDMLVTRIESSRYAWVDTGGEIREIREWILLQRTAPERRFVLFDLPPLLAAWSVNDNDVPEGWNSSSTPPTPTLIDFPMANGFESIIGELGLPYLFRLFSDDSEAFDVFSPLPKPFFVRASQLYMATNRDN